MVDRNSIFGHVDFVHDWSQWRIQNFSEGMPTVKEGVVVEGRQPIIQPNFPDNCIRTVVRFEERKLAHFTSLIMAGAEDLCRLLLRCLGPE